MRQLLFWKGNQDRRESALWLLSRFAFVARMKLACLKAIEKVVKRATAVDFV